MTLTDIRLKLADMAMCLESYSYDHISEELLVLSDELEDLEYEVVGTLSGLAQGLKGSQGSPSPFILGCSLVNQLK